MFHLRLLQEASFKTIGHSTCNSPRSEKEVREGEDYNFQTQSRLEVPTVASEGSDCELTRRGAADRMI